MEPTPTMGPAPDIAPSPATAQIQIDQRVQEYYGTEFDEQQRLARPAGRLELVRVREVVGGRLAPESRVADIGGGAGAHAAWLAEAGHEVVLVDPVPRHVRAASLLPGVQAVVGDARHLSLPTAGFDAALVFGPLYHLASRDDRVLALSEARRIVHPGGLVFAAVIPRWAAYSDAMTTLDDGASAPGWLHALVDSGASPTTGHFPAAHFHTSAELAAEMADAGLEVIELLALEGPGGLPLEFLGADADDALDRKSVV